ncbi:MAG: hypothetical protein A2W18_05935 [Candidatus Muproteobacteria bacterium RBG_16_60_9]|uniref:Uncharacterized protein n=1 Tax=Candidatus Muproteobacteria bacterium RBG_16_60_9 TaxID=1817755 RepID=A0A1F6V7A7_9PROT|nr:MAG: hypothetical protein A2W18_05935 [Candidatus Muproteobacteria bacterium RBG_16_60_9]
MKDQPKETTGGFWYYVSDEQLAAFAALSDFERLRWVDEARQFTLMARTPETAQRQERLRRGECITPDDDKV